MIKLTQLISELQVNNPNRYKVCDWVKNIFKNIDWDVVQGNASEDEYDSLVILSELNFEDKEHFTKQDIRKKFELNNDLNDMWGGSIDELIQHLLVNKVICQ